VTDTQSVLRKAKSEISAASAALAAARADLDRRVTEVTNAANRAARAVVSRPEAEAAVDRVVSYLAGQAAGIYSTGVLRATVGAESQLIASLRAVPATALLAWLEPERLKGWLLQDLDRQAAKQGGWSTMGKAEREAEARRLLIEQREIEAAERELLDQSEALGVSLPRWGDSEPGVFRQERQR
jgi:hypothetical protein